MARRLSFGWRLAIAAAVEAAWETVENSEAGIARHRSVTISLDCCGDSVINPVADILAMVAGFWPARVIRVSAGVALVVFVEVLTALVILDGLARNVLMLLWPLEAVHQWQAGG